MSCYYLKHVLQLTWMCNTVITVAIPRILSNSLDPVFELGDTGVYTRVFRVGTLSPLAHNPNLSHPAMEMVYYINLRSYHAVCYRKVRGSFQLDMGTS